MPVTDDDEYDGPVSMAATQSTTSKAEQRKSNKPIMEKRRRARINHCLNELKNLILNAMKKDPARHSKLEKADILEMTVKHLQSIQRQQLAAAVSTDPTVITRFRNGFDECASEVSRYISRLEGVDSAVKQRLSAHLHRCVSSLQQMTPPIHSGPHDDNNNSSSQRTVLIPSRLPTGELALVLPNYNSFLAAAPNSAFTAIKPPSDAQRRFQPFQVEIPNSHLKAHISLPESFDMKSPNSHLKAHLSPPESFDRKSPIPSSPKKYDLPPRITDIPPPHKHQVSSTESFNHHHQKPSLPELEIYEMPRMVEPEKRSEMNLVPHKAFSRPHDAAQRLVRQKPNPNYALNPKVVISEHKFGRYGELSRGRPVESSEPPPKIAKFILPSPPGRPSGSRSSVIVSESISENPSNPAASGSRLRPSLQERESTQQDMWRPW